jgi:hypothetical protein
MKDMVRLPVPTVSKLEASGDPASGPTSELPSEASEQGASESTVSSGSPVAFRVPSAS